MTSWDGESLATDLYHDVERRFAELFGDFTTAHTERQRELWTTVGDEGDAALDAAVLESLRAMGYMGY